MKKDTAEIEKKIVLNKKRVAKAADDLEIATEVNKNLNYSIMQLQGNEPDLV